jgi:DNA adenine methylase
MLRYPGGKTRAVHTLDRIIQEENLVINKAVYSVFYGGGSFELFLRDRYGYAIYANDYFKPLISFWSTLQETPHKLRNEVQALKPLSKTRFIELQGSIMSESNTLKQAAQFYALNRASFSGAILCGGFSKEAEDKRFTQSSIDRIQSFDSSNIEYTNLDFADFIDSVPEGEFMFLDPPYLIESNLYGAKGDLHKNFDHKKLATKLNARSNWMLCYNNCDAILDMYLDPNITGYEANWSYGMNKSKKSSEIVLVKKKGMLPFEP